jgi:hypothetical protein
MEVRGENYLVVYDQATATIMCRGLLRLYGATGYSQITELLHYAADQKSARLTLDLRQLEFLNSSGINTISKFVIRVRNYNSTKLILKGSRQISWHGKSLENLQRLMPELEVVLE